MIKSSIKDCIDHPVMLADYLTQTLIDKDTMVVNVYDVAKELGIYIKYATFESNQGGFYIPPNDEDDIHLVVLNAQNEITRQRFSLAHEIGHVLRYRYKGVKVNSNKIKNKEEKFCNAFAEHFLVPREKLDKTLNIFDDKIFIEFEDIHVIARTFGVSFSAMTRIIAYRKKRIPGETDDKVLRERIDLYLRSHKDNVKDHYKHILSLYRMAINAYPFDLFGVEKHRELRRLNNYIYNELKNEGLHLPVHELSELITDARFDQIPNIKSYHAGSEQRVVETIGQYRLYKDICDRKNCDELTLHDIRKYHKRLYALAPYQEDSGKFRSSNTWIGSGTVETVDYTQLSKSFYLISRSFDEKENKFNSMDNSEIIEYAVKIHYELVRLHPFPDGNGRVSRAFMNKIMQCKDIPLIFFYNEEKNEYIKNLQSIDKFNNYMPLFIQVYKAIMLALAN